MRINSINLVQIKNRQQLKHDNKKPAAVISNPMETEYYPVAFSGLYSVTTKKINLEAGQNKLLRLLDKLLESDSPDAAPEDLMMSAINRALNTLKHTMARKKQIYEELQNLRNDRTLNPQQKLEKARVLRKEFESLNKNRVFTPKPETPKTDEKYDYLLLRKLKAALEDGEFNLGRVLTDYYSGLNEITIIKELNKRYPKIKVPKRPEDVIASKIVSTLPRDFYMELDEAMETGDRDKAVALINRKLVQVCTDTAKAFPVDSAGFGQKIVTPVTEAILQKYYSARETGIGALPNIITKKASAQISLLDIKLLASNFDDFVLSVLRKHYIDGERLNNFVYEKDGIRLAAGEFKNTEYRFEKMPDKIKAIIRDSDRLFSDQRDYARYDTENFKARLSHYAESEMADNDIILSRIVDFDSCSYTPEDVKMLTKFLQELDNAADKKITVEQAAENITGHGYKPSGTEKLNEIEKLKAEKSARAEQKKVMQLRELKNNFNNAINLLYMHDLNNIALTCSKYEPKSLEPDELENAQNLIKLITELIPKDSKTPFNKIQTDARIRRWDAYTAYKTENAGNPVFIKALQYANENGQTNIQKAGQYIINSEIVQLYPQSLEFAVNPEILTKIINSGTDDAAKYLCKYEDYKDAVSDGNNILARFIGLFNLKDTTDKTILKYIIENDYITAGTTRSLSVADGGKPIPVTIASKAKLQIADKYKFPVCLKYFTEFEDAMTMYAGEKGSSGVKLTGKNNKSTKYKMELKITGENDRLFSSKNDYYFDIFDDVGLH